jgi:hypothetical protein
VPATNPAPFECVSVRTNQNIVTPAATAEASISRLCTITGSAPIQIHGAATNAGTSIASE